MRIAYFYDRDNNFWSRSSFSVFLYRIRRDTIFKVQDCTLRRLKHKMRVNFDAFPRRTKLEIVTDWRL